MRAGCVGPQPVDMRDKAQPGLFEEVLRAIAIAAQTYEEREQPRVEAVVDHIEGRGVACLQAPDEIDVIVHM